MANEVRTGAKSSLVRSYAKSLYCRALGIAARSEQPHATHIPVLVGVAAAFLPERVVEFGSGDFSTLALLDKMVFPSVLSVESYENDAYWMQKMTARVAGNQRVKLRYFEGRMREAVRGADLAVADLVFIDDSLTGWERARTIKEVAKICGERPIMLVHDYELPGIRMACRRFEHRVAFTRFTPQSCAVWNGNPHRSALMARVERKLEASAHSLGITDASAWAKAFAESL